jgi:selenocysteine lyase/cysteine desulfurase
MFPRREFVRRAAVAAALFGVPFARAEQFFSQESTPVPPRPLLSTDPRRYWSDLRRQWLLASDRINLNCGSVGCVPMPVLRATIDHILHVSRDELALVRNATEANNIVVNGLDLKPGDEVLLTDQEHPGGRCPWEQKAARFGVKLNTVSIPKPPATAEEIVDRFEKALTPKTRLIFFSHITTVTGVVLPAKEICAMARDRGVLSQVDGAHAIGQIPLDLHDIGCDFYGTSPHKWLMAPKGTGALYIRDSRLRDLWVNIATANWNNYDMKAYRFSWFGTSNLSVMVGLKAALDFHQQLGPEIVYARIHELASQVRDRLSQYPQVRIVNASADRFYGGMVTFEPDATKWKGDFKRVLELCVARNMRIAGAPDHIRLSTHIFTQPGELDAFFDVLATGLA